MSKDILKDKEIDYILILGASVLNGKPRPMLKDRLDVGINLYDENITDKIIVSGDHGDDSYNEVKVMNDYAIERDVNPSDIYMDHAGFSTYDSIYRAKNIYNSKKIVIVTQKYHLYRALYIADKLGIDCYGVDVKSPKYNGDLYRELREILARCKDFFKAIIKPTATYIEDKKIEK